MKRAVLSAVFLASLAALGGCPIYSHGHDGCWRDKDCQSGYLCDDSTGECYSPGADSGRCIRPSDCGVNQTCSSAGLCVSGDCSFSGCVSGYRCAANTGTWQCVSNGTPNDGAGGGSAQAAGAAGAESSSDAAGAGGDASVVSSSGAAGEASGG